MVLSGYWVLRSWPKKSLVWQLTNLGLVLSWFFLKAFFGLQEHNHPHILLLQIGNTFCKLPGGRLKPGENGKILLIFSEYNSLKIAARDYLNVHFCGVIWCLQKMRAWRESWLASLVLIHQLLCLTGRYYYFLDVWTLERHVKFGSWWLSACLLLSFACILGKLQIGECVAIWWRPNFETIMYPYCPPHITKPKVTCEDNAIKYLAFLASLVSWSMLTIIPLNILCAGVQKAFPCSFIWEGILCSAQKFKTTSCSIVWTLWQCSGMALNMVLLLGCVMNSL